MRWQWTADEMCRLRAAARGLAITAACKMPVALELGTRRARIECLRDLVCAYSTMLLHIIGGDAIGDPAKAQPLYQPLEQQAAVVLKNCLVHAPIREIAAGAFTIMRIARDAADA